MKGEIDMKNLKVCWLSAGVSSFVAGYLVRDTIDQFIYIDVTDQHPDSLRFIKDCEKVLGKEVLFLKSKEYKSVEDVCRAFRFIKNRYGARCTMVLKKRVRKEWEYEHRDYNITYVWGMDKDEQDRAQRIIEGMPEFNHEFPLIDYDLSKGDAHGICRELGIKRPAMYDLGYSNNNCIGCIKGGAGYWNKIRVDFPEVFAARAKMERDIGMTILRDRVNPGKLFLDELDPNKGRMSKEIMEDCGIACELALNGGD